MSQAVPQDPAVLRSVADRLRAAMSSTDPTMFADLLDPHVRWGTCGNRNQVLAWYRAHAGGVRVEVVDMAIRDDTIVLNLVAHEDGGADPITQVFRVANGAITEIRPLSDEFPE